MSNLFPTRYEMKCSGCSFIIAQLLLVFGIFMLSIDYDLYGVHNEEQVITLHNLLSSQKHRTEVEIAVSSAWIAFPFLLIGLFGIKKTMKAMYAQTSGEMFVFLAIQSYIIFITMICILVPAISLTASAFEWSFHEYTPEPDFIPTGYYIQLYLLIFNAEVIDCVSIADAVFMISLFILPRFFVNKNNAKFKKMKSLMDPSLPNCLRNMQCLIKFYTIIIIVFVISLFVIFCIVLFEFAESGFFSPTGKAKFLLIWSFILKIFIGIKMTIFGYSKRYDTLKNIFVNEGKPMLGDDHDYTMEQIDIETNKNTQDNLNNDDDTEL